MSIDVDGFLLDRVFQPAADRLAETASCFTMARLSLLGAVMLQTIVLCGDLVLFADPVMRMLAGGITVLAFFGADRGRVLIARAERASRSGTLNVRRITLRWQRMAWLAIGLWSVATSCTKPDAATLGLAVASLFWLATIYFVSCSPAPPTRRVARHSEALPTFA